MNKKIFSTITILSLYLFSSLDYSFAATNPKYGDSCPKLNLEKTYKYITFVCLNVNGKLVWTGKQYPGETSGNPQQQTVSTSPSPTSKNYPKVISKKTNSSQTSKPSPTPSSTISKLNIPSTNLPIPTSFQDMFQNRSGIAYGAWVKTSGVMKDQKERIPPTEIYIGPQTTPWNSNVEAMMGLVSQTFPNFKLPSKVVAYFYNYKDLEWASTQVKQKLNSRDFSDLNRNEGGKLVESNCQVETQDCMGAKEQTTTSGTDIALLLIGVTNHPGMYSANDRTYGDPGLAESSQNGLLLAHEYFHALQREQMIGKSLQRMDWPPSWIREGSATFVQNASVYSSSFTKYYLWRDLSMKNVRSNFNFDEKIIADYLSLDNYSNDWNNYNQDWAYLLGSRIVEALVSVKGPQSILDFYNQMSLGIGFQAAFKNVYDINYTDAIPILSKVISSNFATQ